jgi:hypothetical protein
MFRMNTLPACEYIMFAPAHLLRNCHEQRPSSHGDVYSNVKMEVGVVLLHWNGPASDFVFVP